MQPLKCGGVRSFMEAKKTKETRVFFERLFSCKNVEYFWIASEIKYCQKQTAGKITYINMHECSSLPFYLSILPSFFSLVNFFVHALLNS